MNGKCPGCKAVVTSLRGADLEVTFWGGAGWKAVTYNCPYCSTILGTQIDPIALRTDIVNMTTDAVLKALGRA